MEQYIKTLGLNSIPRMVVLILVIVLLYYFYQSPCLSQLRHMNKFKQSGGAIDSSIGMIMLMGLTILAFILSFKSINMTTLLFIILFMVIGFIVSGNFILSLAIAIILSSVILAYSTTGEYQYEDREGFEDAGENNTEETDETAEGMTDETSTNENKEEEKEDYAKYADDPADAVPSENPHSNESFKSKTVGRKPRSRESFKSKTVGRKLRSKESFQPIAVATNTTEVKEEDIMDDEDEETFEVDKQSSMVDIYKSLSKDQVSGMKKDTIELMKTQQELIQTLNTMGPVLQQSKGILSSFQNYFGNDEEMKNKLSQLSKV